MSAPRGMRFASRSRIPAGRVSQKSPGSPEGNSGGRPLFRAEQTCRHPLGIADRLHSRHHADGPGHHGPLVHHGQSGSPGGNVIARNAFRMRLLCAARRGGDHQAGFERSGPERASASTNTGRSEKFIWRAQTDTVLDQIFSGKPYPIKALWIQTGNIIAGIGFEPKKWREAFKQLDFMVAVDLFKTPTTQYAGRCSSRRHVPGKRWRTAVGGFLCRPSIKRSRWMAASRMWRSILSLRNGSIRTCAGNPWMSLFDSILQKSGMSFRELQAKNWAIPPEGSSSAPYHRHEKGLLRKDGQPGFATTSGKVELYSRLLREEWGLEPLPHYEEPPFTPVSRPDLAKEYPLISFYRQAFVCIFQCRTPEHSMAARN